MDRDPRVKELDNLKEALANFEHQLDLFEARVGYQPETQVGYQPKESQAPDLAPADPQIASAIDPQARDPQIAFASNVVAAMKNRMSEDHATAGLREATSPDRRW